MHRDDEGERHSDKNDDHLIALGDANDFCSAKNRVGDGDSAREPDGQI